jgi:hypothetical protein
LAGTTNALLRLLQLLFVPRALFFNNFAFIFEKQFISRIGNIFYDKGPHPLLWAGSPAARRKVTVSGIPNCLNYFVIFILHTQFTNLAAGRMRAEGCLPMAYIKILLSFVHFSEEASATHQPL